jgi:hypothetical protein
MQPYWPERQVDADERKVRRIEKAQPQADAGPFRDPFRKNENSPRLVGGRRQPKAAVDPGWSARR